MVFQMPVSNIFTLDISYTVNVHLVHNSFDWWTVKVKKKMPFESVLIRGKT